VVVSTPASEVVSSTDGDGVVSTGHVGYLPHRPLTRSAPASAHEHSSILQSSIGKQSPSFPHPKVQLHLSGHVFGGMVTS
jgi:predicted MPP superfamily phosphohydrolase